MNAITRCPSCATYYQVAQADLQTAQGWLRCGQCGHVFDSTGLVLQWTPSVAVSEKPDPTPALLAEDDLVADPADHFVVDDLLQQGPRSGHSASAAAAAPGAQIDAFEQALASFKPTLSPPSKAAPVTRGQATTRNDSWGTLYLVWMLALVLFLQLVFVQRHTIVALWAYAGPSIRYVCQSFACQVRPIRDVQGLVIESSEWLSRDNGNVLRWTMRNTTARPVGMTALELSLLEGSGKVAIRRVFLPSQTGAPEVLAAQQSWSGELNLWVDAEPQFRDHRLQNFYP